MTLELAAMRWLWLEQKCLVVLEQRTPKYGHGIPDVIGVTPGRHLTEIEIKRSVADFRADADKPHRANRAFRLKHNPRLFYYLVPTKLAERCQPILPDWAGLMTMDKDNQYSIAVLKRSPINREATRLDLRQCTRLARQMTAHMMGYASRMATWNEQRCQHDSQIFIDWTPAEVGTYEI